MDELQAFVERDSFAKYLGVEVLEYGRGHARAQMEIRPHHLNSAGILHGGAIFSLADAAFAAASNSHGRLAVAISASISFFAATKRDADRRGARGGAQRKAGDLPHRGQGRGRLSGRPDAGDRLSQESQHR